jgi:hypothetical protein
MTKKLLIVMLATVLALGAFSVMAQDGPGVINITLPDGGIVPVFTDGRLNAFDQAAPVVVYYTAANGTIVNPNFTTDAVAEVNLGDTSASTNANNATTGTTTNPPVAVDGLINKLQVLAIDPTTSNGNLIMEVPVSDLQSLVVGQEDSISQAGYSVNFDPESNHFWVQSPANFEGKVYTFAWRNNLFASDMIAQRDAQASAQTQATGEPAQAQPTAEPATSSTSSTYP